MKNKKLNFTQRMKGLLIMMGALPILIAFALPINAQDYTDQVTALSQSFKEHSVSPIEPYLSPELKFDPIPADKTMAILGNIFTNLPALKTIEIVNSANGLADLRYDFDQMGIQESALHFDSQGKIVRFELVEDLIRMEMEQRKQMEESVKVPLANELTQKHLPQAVQFPAADGLLISGNLYEGKPGQAVVLLCHQAGYNRMEYLDIAPQLVEMGYTCLAIDQRSGGDFAGASNATVTEANKRELKPTMWDASADIKAAIDFLHQKYQQKIILWGSSYSASLVLHEAAGNEQVKAIIAFSPGDYFGEAAPSLSKIFPNLQQAFWISSSQQEASGLATLLEGASLKENQQQFIPQSKGFHGSRVLWGGQEGAEEYWASLQAFLNQLK